MKLIALSVLAVFTLSHSVNADSNQVMKNCLVENGYTPEKFDTFNFSKAASCHSDYRIGIQKAEYAELRNFLKHNPRYRYPGQSMNKCFGKPREMPFESAYIERTGDGFKAGVSYKDTMPTGCYENAPWDNRDVER